MTDSLDSSNEPAEISWETINKTYTGVLDDVMLRYSRNFAGKDFFTRMLAKNLFFGGGLFINDGYLANHDVARSYLYDDDSLLRWMINTDFVQVLTRKKSSEELAKMPVDMAQDENVSFVRLVNSNEWKNGFEGLWKDLATGIFRNHHYRGWPPFDLSEGFDDLIQRVFPADVRDVGITLSTDEDLEQIKILYDELGPRTGNARDSFEKACLRHFTGNPETHPSDLSPANRSRMDELMNIANQAYHYNFGLTLTEDADDFGVAVDTTVGDAFDELLQVKEIQRARLSDIPLLALPDNLPLDSGEVFYPFLDPASKVSKAKIEYLQALADLFSGPESKLDDLKRDVKEATRTYFGRILALFGAPRSELERLSFLAGFTNVDKREGASVVGSPSPALSLALINNQKRLDVLLELFRVSDELDEEGVKKGEKKAVTLEEIKPEISALAFRASAASEHCSNLKAY